MPSMARDFVLSNDEYQELYQELLYQELKALQKNTSIKCDHTRVSSLIMLHLGHPVKDISEVFEPRQKCGPR